MPKAGPKHPCCSICRVFPQEPCIFTLTLSRGATGQPCCKDSTFRLWSPDKLCVVFNKSLRVALFSVLCRGHHPQ